jgi:hypothetical protein
MDMKKLAGAVYANPALTLNDVASTPAYWSPSLVVAMTTVISSKNNEAN